MAQKPRQNLSGIFSRAEQEPEAGTNADLDEGRIISAGVGIKEGELAAFQALADRHDITKNAIMRIALRYFLVQVRAGKINPEDYLIVPDRPKKKTRLPK